MESHELATAVGQKIRKLRQQQGLSLEKLTQKQADRVVEAVAFIIALMK